MRPLACLFQVELRPADNDLVAVLYEIFDQILEVEKPRTAVYKGNVVD